jgi:hypothetical protein
MFSFGRVQTMQGHQSFALADYEQFVDDRVGGKEFSVKRMPAAAIQVALRIAHHPPVF